MIKIDLVTLRRKFGELMRDRLPLPLLRMMFETPGRVFQLPLPEFKPYVVAGAMASRKVLVVDRDKLLWRNPDDPVAGLFRRGVLVVVGPDSRHNLPQTVCAHMGAGIEPRPGVMMKVDRK